MEAFCEAYPLYWPEGRPRTLPHKRREAVFRTTFAKARDGVVHEVALLVGTHDFNRCGFVLSSGVPLRRDGLPYAGQRQPEDPGAAVYFMHKKKRVAFACDRWRKVEDNVWAIAKTIEAMRGIGRWGTGEMVDAAFMGFTALPPQDHWSTTLGVPRTATPDEIRDRYRILATVYHPDKGGDAAMMAKINAARDAALKEG